MDASLAATSNLLVYSAMSVYVLAFVAFALDLSGRGRPVRPTVVRSARENPVTIFSRPLLAARRRL